MKKYIISKNHSTESSYSSPHGVDRSPSSSPEPYTTKEEQEALLQKAKSVQPPLPSVPPPVDDTDPNLQLKQNVDLNVYENNNDASPENLDQQNNASFSSQYDEEASQRSKPTICRDFIRGTCIRGAICKFAHEYDLSQLEGVYKFCRNYQNAVCVLPYCRYVHATVFEEQRFYRTGILPPHAFSHLKKPIVLPPPPPPPPPPEEPPPPTPAPQQENVFKKPAAPPPRTVKTSPVKPTESLLKQMIKCVPTANLEARPAESEFTVSPPQRDRDVNAKKCDNCDTMEFRLQFNKDKAENMIKANEDLAGRLDVLTVMTQNLYSVLQTVMKLQSSKLRPEGINGLSSLLSLNKTDKETMNFTLGTMNL